MFPERSLRNQNTSIRTAKISDGWQVVDCNAPRRFYTSCGVYDGQGPFEPAISLRAESRSERRVRERVILIGLLFVVLLLVGCGGPSAESGPTDKCELANPPLFEKGQLTVATDKPAYPPWFTGSPKDYSGYEGDVASEIAERMDLPIKWTVEPFNKSYAPGAKDFDFDINEITITKNARRPSTSRTATSTTPRACS